MLDPSKIRLPAGPTVKVLPSVLSDDWRRASCPILDGSRRVESHLKRCWCIGTGVAMEEPRVRELKLPARQSQANATTENRAGNVLVVGILVECPRVEDWRRCHVPLAIVNHAVVAQRRRERQATVLVAMHGGVVVAVKCSQRPTVRPCACACTTTVPSPPMRESHKPLIAPGCVVAPG